jgi:hypothetical protein
MTPAHPEGTHSAAILPVFARTDSFGGNLSQTARRISRGRNLGGRGWRACIRRNFGRGRLRQSDPDIHFEMILCAARAKPLARVFIAQAGKFIAAVDAIAVSRRRSRLDRHQSHCVCPFLQDTTSGALFAQAFETKFQAGGMILKPLLIAIAGRACRYFPATPSKAWIPSPETRRPPWDRTVSPSIVGFPLVRN